MTIFGLNLPHGGSSRTQPSAEERLLQVIQSGGEQPVKGSVGRQFRGFYRRIWSALKQRRPQPDQKPAPGSDIVRLNKALGAVVVVGLSLAVINAFFFKPDIGRMHTRVASALTPQVHSDLNPIAVEEFLTPITGRNLFQPKTEEAPSAAAPLPVNNVPTTSNILENLQLVGIAWGAQAEAMIREKKEGRTFFLKQGEQLRGVLIKEILKDRVVVEYEGQTKELI